MDLKFFLTLNNKLISVNDLYKAKIGYKFNHPYPILYKNPKAVKLSDEMRDQMRALQLTQEQLDWLKKTKQFTLYLHPVFKVGISSRDASNIVKLAEDQLVKYINEDLGITTYDDSMHIKVVVEKAILPGSSHEFLGVCLGDYVQNVRFDKINKPEKLWINYDKELEIAPLPKRKKKGVTYLQKVNKDEADTLIYLIESKEDLENFKIDIIRDLDSISMLRKYDFALIAINKSIENEANDFVTFVKKEYTNSYSGIKIEYFNNKEDIINKLENYV